MITAITAVLSLLGTVAKNAWSYVRAQLLMAWTTVKLLGPLVTAIWLRNRLVHLAIVLGVCYAIQRVIRDVVALAVVATSNIVGISGLIGHTTWASWLIWDGPLQFSVLWSELYSILGFWVGLRLASWWITRIEWFESQFLRSLGRSLGG